MSSVEGITTGLAAATVQDHVTEPDAGANTTAGGSQPINAAENEAVLAVVAEGRRLYIGNLAYATTEGDLNAFFKGYLVESTSIPVNPRTTRPVGYAFVDLASSDEAQRAIKELSGQEINERKVSVQLARKPETQAEKAENGTPRRRSFGERGRGRGRGRGRAGRGGRGGRHVGEPNTNGEVLPLTDSTTEHASAQNAAAGQADATDTKSADEAKEKKLRAPRQPRQRGPPEDGIPSKNKVMVANLPYEMSEEKLKELFSPYNPSAAKIALRPIPRFMVKKLQARNEPRKGRGFGFVSLENEEQQQKAVAEMNGKEIDGREIAVKVAIDSPGKEDYDAQAAGVEPLKENGVVQANEPPAGTA